MLITRLVVGRRVHSAELGGDDNSIGRTDDVVAAFCSRFRRQPLRQQRVEARLQTYSRVQCALARFRPKSKAQIRNHDMNGASLGRAVTVGLRGRRHSGPIPKM